MQTFPKGRFTSMLKLNTPRPGARFMVLTLIALSAFLLSSLAGFAQTTVAQGSIQGSITDPTGAVVGGAKITITHKATGQSSTTSSSSSGTYNSGGLIPGDYEVRVEAKGLAIHAAIHRRAGCRDRVGQHQDGGRAGEHGHRSTGQLRDRKYRAGHGAGRADGGPDRQVAGGWTQLPRPGSARARRADSGRSDFRSYQGRLFIGLD